VFSQVDVSKSSLPDFSEQAVMAKLVSDTISHRQGRFLRSKDASAKTKTIPGRNAAFERAFHTYDTTWIVLLEKRSHQHVGVARSWRRPYLTSAFIALALFGALSAMALQTKTNA